MTNTIHAKFIQPTSDPADDMWLASAQPFAGSREYELIERNDTMKSDADKIEEFDVLNTMLNEMGAPTKDGLIGLSLWGRVKAITEPQADRIEALEGSIKLLIAKFYGVADTASEYAALDAARDLVTK